MKADIYWSNQIAHLLLMQKTEHLHHVIHVANHEPPDFKLFSRNVETMWHGGQ